MCQTVPVPYRSLLSYGVGGNVIRDGFGLEVEDNSGSSKNSLLLLNGLGNTYFTMETKNSFEIKSFHKRCEDILQEGC